MIKTKSRAPLNDLDVGPFSDVSFLLIIFFILTTQIISMSGMVLSLPAGAPSSEVQEMDDKQITITLTNEMVTLCFPSGTEHQIDPKNLTELKSFLLSENLKDKNKTTTDRLVVLQSASDVKYDLYYKVVMVIESCGGLLALVEEEPGVDAAGGEN